MKDENKADRRAKEGLVETLGWNILSNATKYGYLREMGAANSASAVQDNNAKGCAYLRH